MMQAGRVLFYCAMTLRNKVITNKSCQLKKVAGFVARYVVRNNFVSSSVENFWISSNLDLFYWFMTLTI